MSLNTSSDDDDAILSDLRALLQDNSVTSKGPTPAATLPEFSGPRPSQLALQAQQFVNQLTPPISADSRHLAYRSWTSLLVAQHALNSESADEALRESAITLGQIQSKSDRDQVQAQLLASLSQSWGDRLRSAIEDQTKLQQMAHGQNPSWRRRALPTLAALLATSALALFVLRIPDEAALLPAEGVAFATFHTEGRIEVNQKGPANETTPVVYSDEHYQHRVERNQNGCGWLLLIDHNDVTVLDHACSAQGPLVVKKTNGIFDDSESEDQYEHLIAIFWSGEFAPLNDSHDNWLPPSALVELQNQARNQEPFSKTEQLIRRQLERAGMRGRVFIDVQRVRHSPMSLQDLGIQPR